MQRAIRRRDRETHQLSRYAKSTLLRSEDKILILVSQFVMFFRFRSPVGMLLTLSQCKVKRM